MKIALVTTPPSVRSGIGDYTRALLPYLRALATVEVFVEDRYAGEEGVTSVADLKPRAHDGIVYQIGNERSHAFMAPLVRHVGGTVVLHDWVLFDLTMARFPALLHGGWLGRGLAWREGGVRELGVYSRRFKQRRRARAEAGGQTARDASVPIHGWHAPEADGRWTRNAAAVSIPEGARQVVCELSGEPGRRTRVSCGSRSEEAVWSPDQRRVTLTLDLGTRPGSGSLDLRTSGRGVAPAEDERELGVFVHAITFEGSSSPSAFDLSARCSTPGGDLSDDRFDLPLNRSIVRFADAFFVHSTAMRERILASRNAPTPIGVIPHGAEPAWSPEDRAAARSRLGIDPDAFLVTSFGKVQPHKRPTVLLEALAKARQDRPSVELALVGGHESDVFDVHGAVGSLQLDSAVHLPGHVAEPDVATWLSAADVAVQLRGPSTGGTSGGAFRAYSSGRAVIASELEEQSELPEACTEFLAPGAGESERLATLLVELEGDPERRAAMELEARRFVNEEAHWKHVAERFVRHLERFPKARASRRALFVLAMQRARSESAAKKSESPSTTED